MSRSNWRFIATFAGLAVFGLLASGYYYLERTEQQPYSVEHYQPARDARFPIGVEQEKSATKAYQPNCQAPQSKDDADLCAQWSAVQSTGEANRLARVSLRVTYLEFAALVVSLIFTGWAARAAARATQIAEDATKDASETMALARQSALASMRSAETASDQVRLSRETLIITERAYVTVKSFGSQEMRHPETHAIVGHQVGLVWQNTGKTPAHGTSLQINLQLRTAPLDWDEWSFPDLTEHLEYRQSLGPAATVKTPQLFIPAAQIQQMLNGQLFAYMWCWFEYDDAFRGTPRRRSEFAGTLLPSGGWPMNFRFDYLPASRFNGVDEFCFHATKTSKSNQQP